MTKTPLVSVIMPVYNDAPYLCEAIDSILGQSFSKLELIILNDASTDQTEEIVLGYNDERLKYYKYTTNRGPSRRRNEGIDCAKGEYVAFMDGDDISEPQRIQRSVDAFSKDPALGIIGSQAQLFSENGNIEQWLFPVTHDKIMARLFFRGAFCNPSIMINKAVLDKYSIRFNENLLLAEDYLLWYEILKVSRGANLVDVLINYRISNSQLTRSRIAEKNRCICKVRNRFLKDIGMGKNEFNQHHEYLDKNWKDDINFFQKAHTWFAEIIIANRTSKVFPQNALEKEVTLFLYFKWRISALIQDPIALRIFGKFLKETKIIAPYLRFKLSAVSSIKRAITRKGI